MKKWSACLFIFCALAACSKNCNQQVSSISSVKNLTGRELTLNVCVSGTREPQDITVAGNQAADMKVASHTEILNQVTADSCSPSQSYESAYLTSKSFGKVKFCHDLTYHDTPLQIVETAQPCPTGYIEQVGAVDNCLNPATYGYAGAK